jgi:hypothetical protein
MFSRKVRIVDLISTVPEAGVKKVLWDTGGGSDRRIYFFQVG